MPRVLSGELQSCREYFRGGPIPQLPHRIAPSGATARVRLPRLLETSRPIHCTARVPNWKFPIAKIRYGSGTLGTACSRTHGRPDPKSVRASFLCQLRADASPLSSAGALSRHPANRSCPEVAANRRAASRNASNRFALCQKNRIPQPQKEPKVSIFAMNLFLVPLLASSNKEFSTATNSGRLQIGDHNSVSRCENGYAPFGLSCSPKRQPRARALPNSSALITNTLYRKYGHNRPVVSPDSVKPNR